MRCQPRYKDPVYIWLKNKQICLLCGESTDTLQPICTPCESELPWLGEHCAVCALPLPMAGLRCGQCTARPPAFERVLAPWAYDFPVDSLITRFKHQAKWPLGRLLGELLAQSLQHHFDEGLERPDALVPVPLASRRLRQRGFNQATLLARWLSAALRIPCEDDLLLRVQDTPAQQVLDARARRRNLRQAFALAPGAALNNRHLALVDDVLTTGATAQALARLLLDAGAARVDVYCLARTPKPGDPA
jgi:ComF family protein